MRLTTKLGTALFSLLFVFSLCQAGQYIDELRAKAAQGDADAQLILGLKYYKGQGVPQNFAEAMKWFKKAADQGDDGSQFNLGLMYYKGHGVLQNFAEAMKWYKKAAAQGNTDAQFNLGLMYYKGQGVPQNYIKAYSRWSVAAALDHQKARDNLSLIQKRMTPEQVAEGQRQADIIWKQMQADMQKQADTILNKILK